MKALPSNTVLTFSEVKKLLCAKEGSRLTKYVSKSGATVIERITPKGIIDNVFVISKDITFDIDRKFLFEEMDDSSEQKRVYWCKLVKVREVVDL